MSGFFSSKRSMICCVVWWRVSDPHHEKRISTGPDSSDDDDSSSPPGFATPPSPLQAVRARAPTVSAAPAGPARTVDRGVHDSPCA